MKKLYSEKIVELGNQLLTADPEYKHLTNQITVLQSKIRNLLDEYETVCSLRESVIQRVMFSAGGCMKKRKKSC